MSIAAAIAGSASTTPAARTPAADAIAPSRKTESNSGLLMIVNAALGFAALLLTLRTTDWRAHVAQSRQ
jgi:hypothetical protein